ncbi:exodeoxyribonuclease VII large subunit [Campylobacter sp. FMV-PI01]|uniref:Exodeoxyribonuclease 7 large subunit n=1 Tax=Campylobacter portucalensis TaxID=2608384 RepID=A0A6L5WF82_9BACT|nr:exodeoxyribonuclease VII large subunit [Campylobacter portucalensis]MSN95668.1 exodeoxyribonuclease VII large subunit [Campylobacter portucalensis]
MILSVSDLNEQAKALLEINFANVEVRGEISSLTKHSSGHWYFVLKDKNASINCVMFKPYNSKIKFEVSEAMEVIASAKVTIYKQSGNYQLTINSLRVEGIGNLELAFNQLKEKLEKEGLFDINHKKPLPYIPQKIALITSITSAAYQDILRVAKDRNDMCKIYVYNSLMQGEMAPNSIINSLKKADLKGYDAIVIARGGGSKEDLWCFNDEKLARAIFEAKTPIISAIGHEIDYSISDFVSDHRSLTPTAAIVDLLPEKMAFIQWLDAKEDEILNLITLKLNNSQNLLTNLDLLLKNRSLNEKLRSNLSILENLELKIKNEIKEIFAKSSSKINLIQAILDEKEHFYKITKNLVQVSKDGKILNLKELKSKDEIMLCSQNLTKKAIIK